MPPKVGQSDLIADYRRLAQELGEAPTKRQYNNKGEYSEAVIYNYYRSMAELKEAAGWESGQERLEDEKLLSDLQRVREQIGRTPPIEEYQKHGEYDSKTLKRRFGNWHEVLTIAGFEPTDHSSHWKDNEPTQIGKHYKTVTVECSYCDEATETDTYEAERHEKHFCDSECHAEYMSEQSGPDTNAWEGGNAEYECEHCGETVEIVPARADDARFCSYECLGKHHQQERSGEDSPRWKGGYKPYYGPNWRAQRRKARKRDNHECQVCGMTRAEHQDRWDCNLPVHHIQRFGSFDRYDVANQLPNLITLCRPHHSSVEAGEQAVPEERKARFQDWFSAL